MLDLNHILLFVACVSPLLLLLQGWRRGGLSRGWWMTASAVLLITGVSWWLKPNRAGFVGGAAWLVLIVAPSVGMRKTAELVAQQRYAAAWRLCRALRFLQPAGGLLEQSELLRALECAQRGDFAAALALLEPLRNDQTSAGRQATAQSFRIRGDWDGLLEWLRRDRIGQIDFALLPLYLRALGEIGARDELLVEFARNARNMDSAPQPGWLSDFSLIPVLAFGGRRQALAKIFEKKLIKLSQDTKEFWIGTAELAAGQATEGRPRLEKLRATTSDALIRADTAYRLEHVNLLASPPLSPASEALLRRIEQLDRPPTGAFSSEKARPTKVVLILIALNVAMFIAETALGGSMNPLTLHRLGALEFYGVWFEGEYWRLLTSLFLHYGPLHLFFNLYGLFIIGPGLERAIGSVRFGICYLVSGLASGVAVLFLRLIGLSSAEQLVGASGCIMGLVGVWAGLLLVHRHAPMAGSRLKNILVIVAIQTAFDLSTPQISMAAHLSGLLTGVILGLIFAPKSAPE